jgi:hypothetical protein
MKIAISHRLCHSPTLLAHQDQLAQFSDGQNTLFLWKHFGASVIVTQGVKHNVESHLSERNGQTGLHDDSTRLISKRAYRQRD